MRYFTWKLELVSNILWMVEVMHFGACQESDYELCYHFCKGTLFSFTTLHLLSVVEINIFKKPKFDLPHITSYFFKKFYFQNISETRSYFLFSESNNPTYPKNVFVLEKDSHYFISQSLFLRNLIEHTTTRIFHFDVFLCETSRMATKEFH